MMHLTKKTKVSILKPLGWILVGLLASACSLEPRMAQTGENDEFARNAYTAPVGIETFRQVMASREVTTGGRANAAVLTVFQASANLFSMDGDALTVSSPMVLALGSLSAAFCNAAFDRDAALSSDQRAVYRAVPMAGGVGSFGTGAQQQFASHLFERALQRPGSSAEVAVITTLLGSAMGGGAGVREATVAACAAVVSSLESWTR